MNQDLHSFSTEQSKIPPSVNLDDFEINEESFRPMTKGLGFHQDLKRPTFKAPNNRETKEVKATHVLNSLNTENEKIAKSQPPVGLEAFYQPNTKPSNEFEMQIFDQEKKSKPTSIQIGSASSVLQLSAWIIDVLMIASFVAITGALLVVVSGIQFSVLKNLISTQDLLIFTTSIFSIYYLLYFTVLDLSSSPGKTIMGIRLVRTDGKEISVKNTFVRSLVSLLSGLTLFLPMLLDFQGRLSETKLVK